MPSKQSSRKTQKTRSGTSKTQSTARASVAAGKTQSTPKTRSPVSDAPPISKTKPLVRKENTRKFTVRRQKGWALATWLIAVIIANIVASYLILLGLIRITALHNPYFSYWPYILTISLGVINVVGAIGLLYWKKWGFYVLVTSSLCTIIPNLILGQALPQTLLYALVPIAVLIRLLFSKKKRWQMFE